MGLQRFTWRWWLLLVGSPLVLISAIITLVGGSKLWLFVLIIGVVLVLVGNPIWAGLRAPKER